MSKTRLAIITGVGLLLVALVAAYFVVAGVVKRGPASVGTALAAQVGCADIYLMHRSPAEAERDDVHSLASSAKLIHLKADIGRSTATAYVTGILSRTAQYRPGLGCTLLAEGGAPLAAPATSEAPTPPRSGEWPQGDAAAPAVTPAPLQAAVGRVFDETNVGGYPDTRAVMVVRGGRIAAERYAPGFDAKTPFLGWSMTKSITSALAGTLVSDGKLALDAPAPVAEWARPGDPRHAITLRQLLTMSSGLKFNEEYAGRSDATQMLFFEPDMAGYAASQALQHPPGAVWSYSSGTANIVSRIVMNAVGGTTADYDRYAHDVLFGPVGLTSMVVEPDRAGVPVGSSYGYATARDGARFGLLYLNRGMVDGRRVLPESWIDVTTTPTPAAPSQLYGAMFWLNKGPETGAGARAYPHCPEDMYLADGHNGQFIAIVPSRGIVIVRLGWTPEGKQFNVDRYFSGILASLAT